MYKIFVPLHASLSQQSGKPLRNVVVETGLFILCAALDPTALNAGLDCLIVALQEERQKQEAFRQDMDRLHAQRKQLLCRS